MNYTCFQLSFHLCNFCFLVSVVAANIAWYITTIISQFFRESKTLSPKLILILIYIYAHIISSFVHGDATNSSFSLLPRETERIIAVTTNVSFLFNTFLLFPYCLTSSIATYFHFQHSTNFKAIVAAATATCYDGDHDLTMVVSCNRSVAEYHAKFFQ